MSETLGQLCGCAAVDRAGNTDVIVGAENLQLPSLSHIGNAPRGQIAQNTPSEPLKKKKKKKKKLESVCTDISTVLATKKRGKKRTLGKKRKEKNRNKMLDWDISGRGVERNLHWLNGR
ncbi:hypothetical protein AAFF_G00094630 [Aldrovandia affinis]|uniref:Uncharacterized protein n=1 Tax=Aldrovandia affinis TaxID=143900 RepID=A0AAD7T463_9TELE|nr:hypothetical protein AAFF_G00094630 [Aldrovandia affinis]